MEYEHQVLLEDREKFWEFERKKLSRDLLREVEARNKDRPRLQEECDLAARQMEEIHFRNLQSLEGIGEQVSSPLGSPKNVCPLKSLSARVKDWSKELVWKGEKENGEPSTCEWFEQMGQHYPADYRYFKARKSCSMKHNSLLQVKKRH